MGRITYIDRFGNALTNIMAADLWSAFRGIAEDAGRTSLDSVNLLSPTVIDPNAYTPEFKGFLVKLERA